MCQETKQQPIESIVACEKPGIQTENYGRVSTCAIYSAIQSGARAPTCQVQLQLDLTARVYILDDPLLADAHESRGIASRTIRKP